MTLAPGAPAPAPEGERLVETPVARIDFGTGTLQQVINRLASDFRALASVLIALRHARA